MIDSFVVLVFVEGIVVGECLDEVFFVAVPVPHPQSIQRYILALLAFFHRVNWCASAVQQQRLRGLRPSNVGGDDEELGGLVVQPLGARQLHLPLDHHQYTLDIRRQRGSQSDDCLSWLGFGGLEQLLLDGALRLRGEGVRERSLVGMQQRSIEIFMSALIQLVPLDIAVDVVAEDRSAAMLQMHSDLVSSERRRMRQSLEIK